MKDGRSGTRLVEDTPAPRTISLHSQDTKENRCDTLPLSLSLTHKHTHTAHSPSLSLSLALHGRRVQARRAPCIARLRERIFIDLMTTDRKLKAFKEGSKGRNYDLLNRRILKQRSD